MGRASGRKNLPRAPQVTPDSPEGRDIGESVLQDPAGSPIPGLTGNIANYETVRREPATGEPLPEFRGWMAHGVPPEEHTPAERAESMRGEHAAHQPPRPPKLAKERMTPPAIPVYITEPAEGGRPLTTLATAKITIPAAGGESVRICGRDETRQTMYVLVETAAGIPETASYSGEGSATDPAAFGTIATTNSVPAGTYQVTATVYLSGTVTGADASNMELFGTGISATKIAYPGVANVPVTFTANITTTGAGAIGVQSIGAASGASAVYNASVVVTPLGTNTATAPTGIRIDHEVSVVDTGNGALLRAGAVSYQELKNCQDELFAISNDSSACTLSVIYLYGVAAAG
jgi:hypothetical protein